MEAEEWKARLVQAIAQQVRKVRLERGISVQRLADICTDEYGVPMKRSVLANFEGGRRPALSLVEVLVIARILEVPPVQLLFPIGLQETTEVLPDKVVDTWAALKWFTGETPQLPGDQPSDTVEQSAAPVRLFRRHDQLVADWQRSNRQLQEMLATMGTAPDSHIVQLASQSLHQLGESLQEVRQQMRRRGLTPPGLIPELAYIEASQDTPQYTPLPEEEDES
ncbi:helix-turn-helix domain-containing protein [Streptomyces sp. NPDC051636]|uniref:helix-turn-helix domain-containing protein n=1 Tax=Streptomyces sp. NPDC051636 TaxID=3365663 RepID=UPI0037A76580